MDAAHANAHDDHDSPEAIRRQTKLYVLIFVALLAVSLGMDRLVNARLRSDP